MGKDKPETVCRERARRHNYSVGQSAKYSHGVTLQAGEALKQVERESWKDEP